MEKYWLVFKSSLQDAFQYRFNFFMRIFRYVFLVTMMALIWLAVLRETTVAGITPQSTVQYFFLAAIVFSLSNFHTGNIEYDIRQGELAKYIVKPLSAFNYYLSYQIGQAYIDTITKALVMLPLLSAFGFGFAPQLSRVALFIAFMPLIFFFTFCVQFLITSLAFWMQEVYSFRFIALSTTRFLSGIIVPLHLFPMSLQNILFYTPFPHLAYTPIRLIQGELSMSEALQGMFVLTCWTLLAQIAQQKVWHKGSHSFESTGI